jgi:hypothetical protein
VHASAYVVDGALKLDLEGRLSRVGNLLSEVECNALALLIVGDVLGRACVAAGLQLGAVDLELVGVEDQVGEAIILGDVGVDGDCALVAELSAKLNVVEGDGIV